MPRLFACLVAIVAGTVACSTEPSRADAGASTLPSSSTSITPAAPSRAPVQIEMRNVDLHSDDGIVLMVAHLRGEMISKVDGKPPVFDDQRSYVLRVSSAEVAMDMASLTNLMNGHIFNDKDAPLTGIEVEIDEGKLKLEARLHKGVPVPISMKADVQATPDGRLRLKTDKISALGIPVKGLMHLFGLDLADVVSLKQRRGIEIDGNDVIIAPGQALPPPEIQGRLTRVRIESGRLRQTFGPAAGAGSGKLAAPGATNRNYVYFSGSDIRFGKLTMSDADLQLIDDDPRDPFDFFPARYNRQLVAGYSKNTPSGGLRTYMPDYADLGRVKDLRPRPRR